MDGDHHSEDSNHLSADFDDENSAEYGTDDNLLTEPLIHQSNFNKQEGFFTMYNLWRAMVLSGTLAGIFVLKGSRALIDASMPALTNEKQSLKMNNFKAGLMLGTGNLSRVIGKLVWGVVLDAHLTSLKAWFLICHLLFVVLLFLFGSSPSYWALVLFWSSFMFFYSMPWPTASKLIHVWFTEEQYNWVTSSLSLTSRASQFLVALLAASLMKLFDATWRTAFHLYPILIILVFVVVVFLVRSSPTEVKLPPLERKSTPVDGKTQWEAILTFLYSPRFWMLTLSTGLASCLIELQSLLPIYYKDEKSLHLKGIAVYAAIPFHLGAVLALLFTKPYDWMNNVSRLIFLSLGNVVIIGSFLVLAFWTHMHVGVSTSLFFLIGYCVCWQYYVPSNLYTMKYGGAHIGKLSTLQDSIQYVFVIIFDIATGYLVKDEQWTTFFIMCAVLSVVGMIASIFYFFFEMRAERLEKRMR